MDYDIIIVGGGPAGATLARLLKDKRVALIDKKLDGGSFRKPCGGLLAPSAQRALAKLGLNLPADVLVQPQPHLVKTIDLNSGLVRHYSRNYINMDRHKFDLWLLSLVPDSVMRFAGRCIRIAATQASYIVTLEDGQQISTKYIVGADGAYSIVRRFIAGEHSIKKYTAVQQWFLHDESIPSDYMAAFDNSLTDSYAWGLNKDGYFIFGAALPYKNAKHDFETLKEKLRHYGYNFNNPVKTETCQALTPMCWADILPGKDNIFLIGEAGGFISPSSLEGISYALRTASILAEAFNNSKDPLKIYKKKLRILRLKLLLKRLKMPFMYNQWLRKLVMKAVTSSMSPSSV